MREKDWDVFFDLVEKIVRAEGTWKQKAEEVMAEARARDADTNFEEVVGWFQE